MDAHTVMEEWETAPFDGGVAGLRDLRTQGFSGAVETRGTWLFCRDGEAVAVVTDLDGQPRPGDVATFEDATGQVHEAPHPTAAGLAAMLALEGDVKGRFFTDDTPLSEVDEMLSEGGFTGYVELSENVLSGDYYAVYAGGEASYVGYLGANHRFISGENAQAKAEGEVGIYRVVAVDLPDIDLPGADDATAGVPTGTEADEDRPGVEGDPEPTAANAGADERTDEHDDAIQSAESATERPSADDDTGDGHSDSRAAATRRTDAPSAGAHGGTSGAGVDEADADGTNTGEADADGPTAPAEDGTLSNVASGADPATGESGTTTADRRGESDTPGSRPTADGPAVEDEPTAGAPSGASSMDVETVGIPSLDPERSRELDTGRDDGTDEARPSRDAGRPQERPGEPRASSDPPADRNTTGATPAGRETVDSEPTEPAQAASTDEAAPAADARARLEEVRTESESRIEDLQADLEGLREERDRLRERVSTLEARLAEAGGAGGGGPALSPTEALSGTSLFVREETRGEATLEDAHAGTVDRQDLVSNLSVAHHTQFEEDDATVDGEPFEAWLRATVQYRFVEWLVAELLFEIRETNSESGLRHLYDALAAVDRVGFGESITVGSGKDGSELTFDVVVHDRRGDPLFVASIDDRREPTAAGRVESLVANATAVCDDHETLAGAFAVTSSFFEPEALDVAGEATSSSLLTREKYDSYVKLARKQGYHLCLVESRDDTFYLTSPEL